MEIALREVHDSDLPVFFRLMNDPVALRMAAFTPEDPADRAGFDAHWARTRTSPGVDVRTVLADGDVWAAPRCTASRVSARSRTGSTAPTGPGHRDGRPADPAGADPGAPAVRPAAADNAGSRRVLEKCGFAQTARARGFAHARGEEIDEVVLVLKP